MKVKDSFKLLEPLGDIPAGSTLKYLGCTNGIYGFSVIMDCGEDAPKDKRYKGMIIQLFDREFQIINKGEGTLVEKL